MVAEGSVDEEELSHSVKAVAGQTLLCHKPRRVDRPPFAVFLISRRGGRVVECTALEMRRGGNSTGGSNPSLSATSNPLKSLKMLLTLRSSATIP
jgi:hypothetical protein